MSGETGSRLDGCQDSLPRQMCPKGRQVLRRNLHIHHVRLRRLDAKARTLGLEAQVALPVGADVSSQVTSCNCRPSTPPAALATSNLA